MTELRLRAAIAFAATAGLGLAGYLVYVHYSGAAISCTSGGCATVQHSSYADLLGVPVALLGLLAYVAILTSTLSSSDAARAAGLSVALAGVGFGGYLLYLQLVVIDALCEWCVGSDIVMTLLAVLTLLRVVVWPSSSDGIPAKPLSIRQT